MKCHT